MATPTARAATRGRKPPTPGGPPPVPAVQHVLVTYAKRGRMRFASHRDVGRAFERAVRRAGLPMAHSAGFSPHPKISYASGTPTGVASEAEYLSLALTAVCEPMRLRGVLDTALPDGIDVIDVREDSGGTLNGRLMASEWLVELPGIEPQAAEAAASAFLAATDVHVERLTNKGVRRLDARAAVLSLGQRGASPAGHAILRMVVRHTEPAVRPEDILTGLRQTAGLEPASPAAVTRVAQGVIGEDGRLEPATADHPGQPEQRQQEHQDVP
jgi:radical SAM-linked protein